MERYHATMQMSSGYSDQDFGHRRHGQNNGRKKTDIKVGKLVIHAMEVNEKLVAHSCGDWNSQSSSEV
jgi:hypothetical protein